jgi:hypothetical protein
MKRTVVQGSKLVFSEAYDAEKKILEVRLRNHDHSPGKIYQYKGVDGIKYAGFKGAISAGRYLLTEIKPHCACERMPDEKEIETPEAKAKAPN